MNPFVQGAHDAGRIAARTIFERLRRDWLFVVAGLDSVIMERAERRGVTEHTLDDAHSAALDGLEAEFDALVAEWAEAPSDGSNTPRSGNDPK